MWQSLGNSITESNDILEKCISYQKDKKTFRMFLRDIRAKIQFAIMGIGKFLN